MRSRRPLEPVGYGEWILVEAKEREAKALTHFAPHVLGHVRLLHHGVGEEHPLGGLPLLHLLRPKLSHLQHPRLEQCKMVEFLCSILDYYVL